MLTEICQYLKNWFDKGQPKYLGDVAIKNGDISVNGQHVSLKEGQYFRIIGSVLNDGVHQYPATGLTNEDFNGGVWSMAIPLHFLALVDDITAWCEKYASVDGANLSPFASESFKGYSYTKSSGASGGNTASSTSTWQGAFASRLAPWRKI